MESEYLDSVSMVESTGRGILPHYEVRSVAGTIPMANNASVGVPVFGYPTHRTGLVTGHYLSNTVLTGHEVESRGLTPVDPPGTGHLLQVPGTGHRPVVSGHRPRSTGPVRLPVTYHRSPTTGHRPVTGYKPKLT